MRAADKCNADLGTRWAGNACMDAVQDPTNQALVTSIADEACARAKLGFSDSAVASAACEEAHVKAEKAAWIEIERAAKDGRQPNLVIDDLMPGLPTGRAATAPDALAQSNKDETEATVARNDGSNRPSDPPSASPASASSSQDSGMNNSTNDDSTRARLRFPLPRNVIQNEGKAEVPHAVGSLSAQDTAQPLEGSPPNPEANVLVLPQASPEFIGLWCGVTSLTDTNATGSDIPPQLMSFCYTFRREGQQIVIIGDLFKGERAKVSSSPPRISVFGTSTKFNVQIEAQEGLEHTQYDFALLDSARMSFRFTGEVIRLGGLFTRTRRFRMVYDGDLHPASPRDADVIQQQWQRLRFSPNGHVDQAIPPPQNTQN